MFNRDFMDYHKDRFDDYSLLIFKNEKLVALLPANKVKDVVFSHAGLSYGGLLLHPDMKFRDVLDVFKNMLQFLFDKGINAIHFKVLPFIYNHHASDELLYLLFITKAELVKRESLSVLNLSIQPKRSKNRIEGYRRGLKNNLIVKELDSFNAFWDIILKANLKSKHGAIPVHSLEEITRLKHKFPNNIRQFNVYKDGLIVAGTTIFESNRVAHSQYISGNGDKNRLGSLDFLHTHLIDNVFQKKDYFDFGSSNENNGLNINEGLQYWKEGFGARTITQDFYKVCTTNFRLLDDVML